MATYRNWFLKYSNRRNHGSLEKWLILGLGKEIYKVSLEHLVVPKSKGLLNNKINYIDGGMSRKYRSQLKELQMAKARII